MSSCSIYVLTYYNSCNKKPNLKNQILAFWVSNHITLTLCYMEGDFRQLLIIPQPTPQMSSDFMTLFLPIFERSYWDHFWKEKIESFEKLEKKKFASKFWKQKFPKWLCKQRVGGKPIVYVCLQGVGVWSKKFQNVFM